MYKDSMISTCSRPQVVQLELNIYISALSNQAWQFDNSLSGLICQWNPFE